MLTATRAAASDTCAGSASPRQALALLRQIQQHRVLAADKTYSGLSRIQPEQRQLFKELKLPIPSTKSAV